MRTFKALSVAAILSSLWAGSAAAQVDAVKTNEPGPDLPPVGRSLFEHLTYNPSTQQFDLPFPIEKLVDALKAKLPELPSQILIPKGRSLARSVGAPDFFKFPRMVLGTPRRSPLPVSRPNGANGLGMLTADRIYIGYNVKAPVVEIISYNEAAGRFEFLKVIDYAPPTANGPKPKLVYASRALCTTCHKNQAPIFSTKQWGEVNGVAGSSDKVAKEIILTMPGKTEFHGFPLKVDRDSVVYGFDTATDRANEIPAFQRLWSDSCGRSDPGAIRCRALTLQFGIMYSTLTGFKLADLKIPDAETYAEFKAAVDKNWQLYVPGGLRIGNANIPTRDPFVDVTANANPLGNVGGPTSQADKDELAKALAANEIPPAFEPALTQPSPTVWKSTGGGIHKVALSIPSFLSVSDRAAIKAAHGNDPERIVAAIAKLQAATEAGQTDLLTSRPLRRGQLVTELLAALGAAPSQIPKRNSDLDHPDMPKAIPERAQANPPDTPPPTTPAGIKMSPFRKFCAPCHESLFGDDRDFLAGTDEEGIESLKTLAPRACCRLKKKRMPPASHDVQPTDAERKVMIDFFQSEFNVGGGNTQCP